jgi:O-antigen ligase
MLRSREAASTPAPRRPEPVPTAVNSDRLAFAAAVISVGVACWLPVLISVETRQLVGWAAAIILGLIVERLTRRFPATVLVAGLVLASSLVSSGLVTEGTRYMPVLVASTAVSYRFALELWRHKRVYSAPPRPVMIAVSLYLVWAAFAAATSVDRRLSATYVAGMFAVLVLTFWVIPNMLGDRSERKLLLAVIGGLGLAIALTVYVGSVLGPGTVFGRVVGDYVFGGLVLAGHPTGLEFGRSAGVYLTPFEPALVMAVGLLALLPAASFNRGRSGRLAALGVVFIIPALALTLDRSAWVAAAIAAGAYAALLATVRMRPMLSATVSLLFLLLLLAEATNQIGVNTLKEVCLVPVAQGATCPDWARQTAEVNLRGGSGLSGRQYLWAASWNAVKSRPLLGFGPGTDVIAIQTFLSGRGLTYKGLTSHSTWLRTAVEMGLPGLGLLLAVIACAAWIVARRLVRVIPSSSDPIGLVWPAILAGLLPAMTFEAFLLGGLTLSSLYLALAIGLLAIPPAPDQAARELPRSPIGARPAAANV